MRMHPALVAIPFLVAACGTSSLASPSPSTTPLPPAVSAPPAAASPGAASIEPATGSPAPIASPSPVLGAEAWPAYRDERLRPALEAVSAALTAWAAAARTSAASGASDADRAAYAEAAARLRTALDAAGEVVRAAVPPCGEDTKAQVRALIDLLSSATDTILSGSEVDAQRLAVVDSLLAQAAERAPDLEDAIAATCAG